MKRLIIYAGFHKTGTTAIQNALYASQSQLALAGIHYPNPPKGEAHHFLAKSRSASSRGASIATLKKLLKTQDCVLVASEFFSELDSRAIDNLKFELKDCTIDVIFSIRPVSQLVSSQYQQLVRIGLETSYEVFVDETLENFGSLERPSLFWRRHNHTQILQTWSEILGPENVHLVWVNPDKPSVLFDWFASFLKLDSLEFSAHINQRKNRSLDAEELALVQAIRRNLSQDRLESEWIRIFRNQFIKTIVSTPSKNANQKKLLMTSDQSKRFANISNTMRQEIEELALSIEGEPEIIKSQVYVKAQDMELAKIHIDTVAKAICSVEPAHYLKVIDSKTLGAELLDRLARKLKLKKIFDFSILE